MHKLLQRQLDRHLGGARGVESPWKELLDAVDRAYTDADADRELLERSLELTSQELVEKNRQLRATNDALVEKAEELEQFAYIASHDLRAPLRAIDRLSSWIEEDAGPTLADEARQHMALLRGRVRRMESYLDALLQYSRAGRAATEAERVELGPMVVDLWSMLGPPPGMRLDLSPMPTVETIRVPLSEVLINLLGNALKHHDRDEGTIAVRVAEGGDGMIELSVSDDGPGIPERFHQRVFELFQTLRARDEVEGVGMGLALVKRIVERHGGQLRLESEGRGTAFFVGWPATLVGHGAAHRGRRDLHG